MLARLATALVLISIPASAVGQPPAEMVHVPAGVPTMGADGGEAAERPVHRVWVSSFLIDRLETTDAQFRRFVERTAHVTDREREGWGWHWDLRWHRREGADWRHPHGAGSSIDEIDRHPVVQVSWHDARAYCGWRGKRLPSEAEWERAARGEGARRYAWGDESPRAGGISRASYGTHECCSAGDADGYRFTAPVGSFPAGRSPFGVLDITGNVWEWVEDSFEADFYARSPERDPVNRRAEDRKVIRGGGWGNDPEGLRATLRHWNRSRYGLSMVGVRCAKDSP